MKVLRIIGMCIFVFFGLVAEQHSPRAAAAPRLARPEKHAPPARTVASSVTFEPNAGQMDRAYGFLARGPGYTAAFSPTQTLFRVQPPQATLPASGERRTHFLSVDAAASLAQRATSGATPVTVGLRLVDGNPRARLEGAGRQRGTVNYVVGRDRRRWHTGIPTYTSVRVHDVYPGIALRITGSGGQIESEFLLAPGADPHNIAWQVTGASSLRLDRHGDLLVNIQGMGAVLRERAPLAYQLVAGTRRMVRSRFMVTARRVAFVLAPYDRHAPLVIDPPMGYIARIGGTGTDAGVDVAADPAGDSFLVGGTASTDFPTTNAEQNTSAGGSYQAFVTKLDPQGTPVYTTYLGGGTFDYGNGIEVDAAGRAFIAGITLSKNFPVTPGAVQTASGGGSDAFVASLSADGRSLLYSTYLGGTGGDGAYRIAVDGSDQASVTGATNSDNFPTISAAQAKYGGPGSTCASSGKQTRCTDAFVTKLSAGGKSIIYSTYLGGSEADSGDCIAVDAAGDAVVGGTTASKNFPTQRPVQAAYGGGADDGFLTELGPSGSLLFSTYRGGPGDDGTYGIATDNSGGIYYALTTTNTNFVQAAAARRQRLTTSIRPAQDASDVPTLDDVIGKIETPPGGAPAVQVEKKASSLLPLEGGGSNQFFDVSSMNLLTQPNSLNTSFFSVTGDMKLPPIDSIWYLNTPVFGNVDVFSVQLHDPSLTSTVEDFEWQGDWTPDANTPTNQFKVRDSTGRDVSSEWQWTPLVGGVWRAFHPSGPVGIGPYSFSLPRQPGKYVPDEVLTYATDASHNRVYEFCSHGVGAGEHTCHATGSLKPSNQTETFNLGVRVDQTTMTRAWISFISGSGDIQSSGSATDAAGNVYIGGSSTGSILYTPLGPFGSALPVLNFGPGGKGDAFIAKLADPNNLMASIQAGQLVDATIEFGGEKGPNDMLRDMLVDAVQRSSTFNSELQDLRKAGKKITTVPGLNSPQVVVDSFESNQIDLAVLQLLPQSVPPNDPHPWQFTRAEALKHVVAERENALLKDESYLPSHNFAIGVQNKVRTDLGQAADYKEADMKNATVRQENGDWVVESDLQLTYTGGTESLHYTLRFHGSDVQRLPDGSLEPTDAPYQQSVTGPHFP